MRISDWSSDVCSSDLRADGRPAPMDHTAAPPPADDADPIDKIGDLAAAAGIRAINVLAWRDLDDPEAGGSEVHIHEVMRRWSDAGVAVTMRTSFAPGQPARSEEHPSELQSLMRN